jgi:hypothetical protein
MQSNALLRRPCSSSSAGLGHSQLRCELYVNFSALFCEHSYTLFARHVPYARHAKLQAAAAALRLSRLQQTCELAALHMCLLPYIHNVCTFCRLPCSSCCCMQAMQGTSHVAAAPQQQICATAASTRSRCRHIGGYGCFRGAPI